MQRITRKKKNLSKISIVTILVTLCIFCAVVVLLVSNLRIHNKRVELREYIKEKEEELRVLQERSRQVIGLDPDGTKDDLTIEKIAREQLLFGKPGEEVVFITFPEEVSAETNKKEPFVWWNPLTWNLW